MVNAYSLRLVADPKSLSRTALGTRGGIIYFENGDDFFPSWQWTDLAPDFAYAWLHGVMRVASGASNEETVFFLDGPYVIELTSGRPGWLNVNFFEDRPSGKIARGLVTAPARQLMENAISVMEQMREACAERGWQTDPEGVSTLLRDAVSLLNKLRQPN